MKKETDRPDMPDFDKLTDRIIAQAPAGPFIGIRTNLDQEDPEPFNPYTKENRREK